jgi:RimJ/RimL family protein N-acetyltransferase
MHAAEMFELLCDPALYQYEGEPPASEAWLRERFARLEARRSPDGQQQWLNWVVRLPEGPLAGYVQATVLAGGTAHIAYVLGSRFWRRGIARVAVEAMLCELARSHGVVRCVAVFKAANHRSQALLRRLGFEPLASMAMAGFPPVELEADEDAMGRLL